MNTGEVLSLAIFFMWTSVAIVFFVIPIATFFFQFFVFAVAITTGVVSSRLRDFFLRLGRFT